MRFSCQSCGQTYRTRGELAGRAFRMACRKCGGPIEVAPGAALAGSAPFPEAPKPDGDIWSELSQELGVVGPATAGADPLRGEQRAAIADAIGSELAAIAPVAGAPGSQEPVEAQAIPAPAGALPLSATAKVRAGSPAPAGRRKRLPALLSVMLAAATVGGTVAWKAFGLSRSAPPRAAVAPAADPAPAPRSADARPATPPADASPVPFPPAEPDRIGALAPEPAAREAAARPVIRVPAAREEQRSSAPRPHRPEATRPGEPGTRFGPRAPQPEARVASIQAAPPAAPEGPAPPFDEARVEVVLTRNTKAFETCLALARGAEPKVALEWEWLPVPVTLVLSPGGKALALVIEDAELNRSGLGRCIAKAAEGIGYPAFSGDTARLRTSIWLHDPSANTHNTRRRGL